MADPKAIVPYYDPHDDGYEYVNNILCFNQNPNPSLDYINPVSMSFAPSNPVPQPSGGARIEDANAMPNNRTLLDIMARSDQSGSSSCRGGTSAPLDDLAPENSNFVPWSPSILPEHSIPYICDCCYVLREITHTNGNHTTRLEIYGSIGKFCHATLENIYGENKNTVVRQHHMINLKSKSMEEVKIYLLQYFEQRKQAGYLLLQDPLTIFYNTLCVGLQVDGILNNVTQLSNNHGSGPTGSRPSHAGNSDPVPSNKGPSGSGAHNSGHFGLGPSVPYGAGPSQYFGTGLSSSGSLGAGSSGLGSLGQERPGVGLHISGNKVPGTSNTEPQVLNNIISGSSGPGNSGAGPSNLRRSRRITLISRPSGSSPSISGPSGSGQLGSGPSAAQPPNLGPSGSRGPSTAQASNSRPSGSGSLVSRPTKSRFTRRTSLVIRDDVNKKETRQNANRTNVPCSQGRRVENDASRGFLSLQRERVTNMTLRDLEPYYDLPIAMAAEKLQLCVTAVKKVCRKGNLERWPYRKIKAIQNKIDKWKSEMRSSSDKAYARNMIAQLEQDLIAARTGRNA